MEEPRSPQGDTTPTPSSGATSPADNGVSFIPEKKEVEGPDVIVNQEDVRRELARSGVSTEGVGNTAPKEPDPDPVDEQVVRPLRTYKEDVEEVLKRTHGSKVSIQAAEAEREARRLRDIQQKQEETARAKKEEERLKQQQAQIEKEARAQEEARRARQEAAADEARLAEARAHQQTPPAGVLTPEQPNQADAARTEQARKERLASEQRIKEEKERIEAEQIRLRNAEEARRQKAEQTPGPKAPAEHRSWVVTLIASLFFIGIGMSVLYGAYILFFTVEKPTPAFDIDTLILAEYNTDVDISGLSGPKLVERLTQEKNAVSVPGDSIVNLALTETRTTVENRTPIAVAVGAPDLMGRLAVGAPSSLARSFQESYMLGFYVSERIEPFLILKPTFYENAFSGMLTWETSLEANLSPLFTLSATTTSSGRARRGFVDKVIENQDTRVLFAPDGSVRLLYSFVNRTTLVVTAGDKSFREVLKRLSAKRISK